MIFREENYTCKSISKEYFSRIKENGEIWNGEAKVIVRTISSVTVCVVQHSSIPLFHHLKEIVIDIKKILT